ncbi:uncharacterized protein DS421_3g73180 [Arachis hypogaea]|nr:uncharacterized protein DS421_3g73180 [Arachis hypogaea]
MNKIEAEAQQTMTEQMLRDDARVVRTRQTRLDGAFPSFLPSSSFTLIHSLLSVFFFLHE